MLETSKHILSTFDEALETLCNKLLWMASLTEKMVQDAYGKGLKEQFCPVDIIEDEEVDKLEKEINQRGFEILVRFQPVAADLRQVISSMRVSQNLERIAEHAMSIGRRASTLRNLPKAEEGALLDPMYREVINLLKDAVTAFSNKDANLTGTLRERDEMINTFNSQITEKLTRLMMQHPENVVVYLNLVFIARHLERIAELAKSIGDDVVFVVSALDVRRVHSLKS